MTVVSRDTKERMEKLQKELGYVPKFGDSPVYEWIPVAERILEKMKEPRTILPEEKKWVEDIYGVLGLKVPGEMFLPLILLPLVDWSVTKLSEMEARLAKLEGKK